MECKEIKKYKVNHKIFSNAKYCFFKIIPAFIIAFVISFMFFIYEPLVVYSSNTEDFWFDFSALITNNLIFLGSSVLIATIFSMIIYVFSKIIKKEFVYDWYLLLFSTVFIVTYIQGNYLASSLPTLDGSPINWDSYTKQCITSIILCLVVLIINITLYIKIKNNYKKAISYISLGILAMLTISLIPILSSNPQIYNKKGVYASTLDNYNKLSSNSNFVILLVDMEDSRTFQKVLEDTGKTELLKDFTYFPDTLSAYPFTRESIPFVLSGEWYEAETNINDYYNKALNESKLIEDLKSRNYDVNIYEQDLFWTDKKALEIENIQIVNSKMDLFTFFKQEAKYTMFKYLPFPLKKYSSIETLNYNNCRMEESAKKLFKSDNQEAYNALDKISIQEKNYFQFIHTDGGHYPWDTNGKFEKIENGTYEDKIEASITYIEKYINRIKESNQYDNTAIILMADHGNNGYEPVGRQNPILYIKGKNEKHDKMAISNKKVSYDDLNKSIYNDLLDGKKSDELLKDIDDNRIRRFIWYKDYDDMEEQILDGHAWETEKLVSTGKKYKR